ncbi:hypothetical protein UlMin_023272 [Ulmus minor]
MLKNMMEDKQLDFNQPFLSVRRFSEPDNKRKTQKSLPKLPPLPVYKSELKSGPIRNPGTVPFVWEQTPGRPKDEGKAQQCAPEKPPVAPKLPPGRVSNTKQEAPDKASKRTTTTQSSTGSSFSSSEDVSNLKKKNVNKDKSSKQGREENGNLGSEDGDEAYLDALDTLSRSESFFMNCSVSGLSGYDQDVEPSEPFLADPQTRDFMMGRFLPAAKAMASDSPKYAPRKQQVTWEQPRQANKVISGDKQLRANQYRQTVLSHYAQDKGGEDSEDESVCESSEFSSNKVCGLLPRFCLKNSFCLLNPVPGMKMQDQFPASSVRRVHAKASYANSSSETKKEHAGNVVERLLDRQQIAELHEGKVEMECKSSQTTKQGDCQELDRSSLYKTSNSASTSPYQNGYSRSIFSQHKGFLGIPEKAKKSRESGADIHRNGICSFRELLTSESTEWEVGSGSPVVEKTLYIDSVLKTRSPSSISSSSDMKSVSNYGVNDLEIPEKSSDTEETRSVDSSLQDIKHPSVMNEKATARPKSLESIDSYFLSCSDRSTQEKQMLVKNGSKQEEDLIQDSYALLSSKVKDQENFNLESQRSGKSCDKENSHGLTQDSITSTRSKKDDHKIDLKSQGSMGLDDQAITSRSSKMATKKKIDVESLQQMKSGTEESSRALVQISMTKAANNSKIDLERQWFAHPMGLDDQAITFRSSKIATKKTIDTESLQQLKSGTEEGSWALVPMTKAANNGQIDLESQRLAKLGNQETSQGIHSQIPLALPLPQSPSESWLKRTLPKISSRNSSLRLCSSSQKTSYLDPKWETIVKSSNVQHGRLRFSEKLLTPIPEA